MFKIAENLTTKMHKSLETLNNFGKKQPTVDFKQGFENFFNSNSTITNATSKLPKTTNVVATPFKMDYAFNSEAFKDIKIFKAPFAGAKSGYIYGNEKALKKLLEMNNEYYQKRGKHLQLAWGDNLSAYRTVKDHMAIPSKYRGGTGPQNSHGAGDAFDIAQLNNQNKSLYDPYAAELVKKYGWNNVGAWDPTHIAFSKRW